MELNLVVAQEGQGGRGGTEPAGDYTFLYGNWNINTLTITFYNQT
jgi:hypothetical protein